ncbi:hypothetical protein MKW98_008172 [Papaver atlanticum]|uniref:Uncharacterized protein n=1 Tax=Papaver atlanticum TaxID=357466 RepID=A0AAD4X4P4_9MAGN|nr:hypothetical protein MKW98_008172 [Papaver atlanticum]
MRFFVIPSLFLLVLLLSHPSEGSLFLFLDRSNPGGGSVSADYLVRNRFPDPFHILEHTPFGVAKDDDIDISPARVNWKETSDSHFIMLDIPGIVHELKKEDIKIEVEESRVLRMSGERKKEDEEHGDQWHRIERSYGKFWRQFRLPDNVDLNKVKAKLENRVLTISVSNLSPDQIKGPKMINIDDHTAATVPLTGGEGNHEL